MHTIRATIRGLHIAPRKVRLVADDIRGQRVSDALVALAHRDKKAALPVAKLLRSAVANAKENAKISNPEETLHVTRIWVDEGRPFKRFMPRAQGRATMIKRRTSHVTLILASSVRAMRT